MATGQFSPNRFLLRLLNRALMRATAGRQAGDAGGARRAYAHHLRTNSCRAGASSPPPARLAMPCSLHTVSISLPPPRPNSAALDSSPPVRLRSAAPTTHYAPPTTTHPPLPAPTHTPAHHCLPLPRYPYTCPTHTACHHTPPVPAPACPATTIPTTRTRAARAATAAYAHLQDTPAARARVVCCTPAACRASAAFFLRQHCHTCCATPRAPLPSRCFRCCGLPTFCNGLRGGGTHDGRIHAATDGRLT